jgi:hypothetical protein
MGGKNRYEINKSDGEDLMLWKLGGKKVKRIARMRLIYVCNRRIGIGI